MRTWWSNKVNNKFLKFFSEIIKFFPTLSSYWQLHIKTQLRAQIDSISIPPWHGCSCCCSFTFLWKLFYRGEYIKTFGINYYQRESCVNSFFILLTYLLTYYLLVICNFNTSTLKRLLLLSFILFLGLFLSVSSFSFHSASNQVIILSLFYFDIDVIRRRVARSSECDASYRMVNALKLKIRLWSTSTINRHSSGLSSMLSQRIETYFRWTESLY